MKRLLTLVLVLVLLLALAGTAEAASAKGTTIRLDSTTGTVSVSNAAGTAQRLSPKMRLYNGYTVTTGANGAAFITLDSTKAIKLDASSSARVKKSGNQLEITLLSGNLFFDVDGTLPGNATLTVVTSTTTTGIHGSSGWINEFEVSLLHGHVTVYCFDRGVTGTDPVRVIDLTSGLGVLVSQIQIGSDETHDEFTPVTLENEGVPAFVIEALAEDEDLQAQLEADVPGIDVDALIAAYEEVKAAEEAKNAEAQAAAEEALEAQRKAAEESADYWYEEGEGAPVQSDPEPGPSAGPGQSDVFTVTLPTNNSSVVFDEVCVNGELAENPASLTVAPGGNVTFRVRAAQENAGFGPDFAVNFSGGSVSMSRDGEFVYAELSVTGSGAVTLENYENLHIVQNDTDDIEASFAGDNGAMVIVNQDLDLPAQPNEDYTLNVTVLVQGAAQLSAGDGAVRLSGGCGLYVDEGASLTVSELTVAEGGILTASEDATLEIGNLEAYGSLSLEKGAVLTTNSLLLQSNATNSGTITSPTEGSFEILEGGALTNYGAIELESSYFAVYGALYCNQEDPDKPGGTANIGTVHVYGGTVSVLKGCTLTAQAIELGVEMDGGTLTNAGTLNYEFLYVGEGATFTNSANCEAGAGSLNIDGTVTNLGTLTVGPQCECFIYQSGTLTNYGTLVNDGTITVEGVFDRATGTVTGDGEIKP